MNILVTGGSGQVGFELQRSLAIFGRVDAPDRQHLNLEDLDQVAAYLEATKPGLIVNAAAWTAVDKAETEQDSARIVNADLPAVLAGYAARNNIWLIHYSSDYVYPGNGTTPWSETDQTAPLSVYGKTKLLGDDNIAASGCHYMIFRTSWVYSARGNNFMKTMLRLGAEREQLSIVNDQWGVPTPARLIAEITALAVSRSQQMASQGSGIYHLAPSGETNWCRFAESIFALAREEGFKLKVAQVTGIPTSDYPTPASRPLNSRLSLEQIERELGIIMPDWYSQLQMTLEEYLSLKNREE
ncbi:dTDP-4-dehydrorhamnose reductase [Amphritea atlantica]|uniref:dTDP-4-dehydrorhamnose reductase n=1 Tax=Amphritea atlantica TaxID=355243 RepID=A0A1H9K8E4_9GAMM|nr:dTDP-4-dehydrorhamnose reductase [Amphritea atlantica]SEQ95404.1 dTDP-4-dehydrorhamnose reductase [Amphritea atlantica]